MSAMPPSPYPVVIVPRRTPPTDLRRYTPSRRPDHEAFFDWLHGAYLTIPAHIDVGISPPSLLGPLVARLVAAKTQLCDSPQLSIRLAAEALFSDLHLSDPTPGLNSRALFSLSVLMPLDQVAKSLMAYIDVAYGDDPRCHRTDYAFRILADGRLDEHQAPFAQLNIAALRDQQRWKTLPGFWRMVTAMTREMELSGRDRVDVAKQMLTEFLPNQALPLRPDVWHVSILNHLAIQQNTTILFGNSPSGAATALRALRLTQGWEGCSVAGMPHAEAWLTDLLQGPIDYGVTQRLGFFPWSFRLSTPLTPVIKASLEAATPDPTDDNGVDPDPMEDPDVDPQDGDADGKGDDEDPTTTPPAPQSPPFAAPVEKNNSIGDISLEQDDDPGRAYLYRREVLSLNDTLARDPNIDVSQDVRQSLHLWCQGWLWLASVTQTKTLLTALGLQRALGPVAKKD